MKFKLLSFFTNDLGRKITALILACLTWFFIGRSINESEIYHDIPVEITDTGSSTYVVNSEQIRISLSLRGSEKSLNGLSSTDIRVTVPMPSIRSGQDLQKITLTREMIRLPQGVTVGKILTPQIKLHLDQVVTRSLPVKLFYQDRLREGYQLQGEPQISEDSVSVTGPRKLLASLRYLTTNLLSIAPHQVRTYRTIATINTPSKVILDDNRVSVEVRIAPVRIRRSFYKLPLQILEAKKMHGKQLAMHNADVELSGPPHLLKLLKVEQIRLFVDGRDADSQDLAPVHFWCPYPEIHAVKISPESTAISSLPELHEDGN